MRISKNVCIVASGDSGLSLTGPADCTVYLVDGGSSCALIDSGFTLEPEQIVRNIEDDGIDPDRVDSILLTHGHGDHAAGARWLSLRLGAKVYASDATAAYVSGGDQKALSVDVARDAGLYPQDFHVPSVPVTPLADGSTIEVGDVRLSAIYSPGHCSGHCCYLMGEDLFCGDVMSAGGRIALQDIWDCDIQAYLDTVRKLHGLHVRGFFPGHGAFSLERGYRHFDAAMERIGRLWLPLNSIGE